MRKILVAGNWKMNKTVGEAVEFVKKLRILCKGIPGIQDIEIVLCPPFTALHAVSQALVGSIIKIGAQDVYWEKEGAFTGEISPPMLRDHGCRYVILGHSERRQHFGETNLNVSKKMTASYSHDLIPIVCVGETLTEREEDRTLSVIEEQVRGCLRSWNHTKNEPLVIAYEPVWAIGTGRNATPEQANEAHAFIRFLLNDLFGERTSSNTRILYGGSVNPKNIESLMAQPELDGTLVGGASLDAESFVQIIKASIRKPHASLGG
ncbi:MAG: triose-phosphate isomerase [candidate division NC10 bacterium]|nr:triose-phosphate isomerase [candidate division NC10 bacterium]